MIALSTRIRQPLCLFYAIASIPSCNKVAALSAPSPVQAPPALFSDALSPWRPSRETTLGAKNRRHKAKKEVTKYAPFQSFCPMHVQSCGSSPTQPTKQPTDRPTQSANNMTDSLQNMYTKQFTQWKPVKSDGIPLESTLEGEENLLHKCIIILILVKSKSSFQFL